MDSFSYKVGTGLYSKEAEKILNEILHNIVSIADRRDWNITRKAVSTAEDSVISRLHDDEIAICSNYFSGYYWYANNHPEIFKEKLAYAFRSYAHYFNEIILQNESFNRHDDTPALGSCLTIKKILFVSDWLLQSNMLNSRYGKEYVDDMVGSPANPFIVEQRNVMEAEIKKIKEECNACINQIQTDYNTAYSKLYSEAESRKEKAREEMRAKIAEIEKTSKAMEDMAASA